MPNRKLDINIDSWGSDQTEEETTQEEEKPTRKRTRRSSNTSAKEEKAEPEIHLEDLMISEEELWGRIRMCPGAFRNWLTWVNPYKKKKGLTEENQLTRNTVMSQICMAVNDMLKLKLKHAKENGEMKQ
jgi:hypothetical protein